MADFTTPARHLKNALVDGRFYHTSTASQKCPLANHNIIENLVTLMCHKPTFCEGGAYNFNPVTHPSSYRMGGSNSSSDNGCTTSGSTIISSISLSINYSISPLPTAFGVRPRLVRCGYIASSLPLGHYLHLTKFLQIVGSIERPPTLSDSSVLKSSTACPSNVAAPT